MSTCHVQLGGGGLGVRAIISLVILFLTTGWSVGLIEYVGSQRRRKSGVYLEGNAKKILTVSGGKYVKASDGILCALCRGTVS